MRPAPIAILLVLSSGRAVVAAPCAPVPVWRDGEPVGTTCPADAAAAGLTIIALDDEWTPSVLAPDAEGMAPRYRATYLALAAERFADAGDDGVPAREDRYLDPYGLPPTLTVVSTRLEDEARHACHAAIDDTELARAPAARLRRRAVVKVVEEHLACDALLARREVDGAWNGRTRAAIRAFQRGVMRMPDGRLGPDTRVALVDSSRERDFRTALRVLRERVIAATGLIEDGTAGAGPSAVLGRFLESVDFVQARGHAALAGAAPDRIAAATEAAAIALGWTDPEATRTFLARHGAAGPDPVPAVAVRLPAVPTYHSAAMQLEVEIDRGDVWYDPEPRARPIERRAAVILYARVDQQRIPLVRWPATIGGWQDEIVDGIAPRWKESPPGPRVWRDLYVAPTWLPPISTPDRELVRRDDDGRYRLQREALGPSYRSAYGLAMLIHHRVETRGATTIFVDTEIRTHGTANLPSLHTGASHGCHRLLGVHALRLAGFLMAHRAHARLGEQATWYRRTVRFHGRFPVSIDTRGYAIRFDPPIPIEVLPGRIRSR